jgi:anthranilate phosphoribosyltransferase
MEEILEKLDLKQDLTEYEAGSAMRELMEGKASNEDIKHFLRGLKDKGETIGEIAAFTRVLRKFATRGIHADEKLLEHLVDTCGSGGDLLDTFNISTTAAFVTAGAGVPVAKHGNRSVSSKSGSADVLETLGVKIDLQAADVERCIKEANIGFMFARTFHGAMKNVAKARKELGVSTVFNILGPLVSPANVRHQVYGVYDPALTDKLAGVLKETGSVHAMVVHGMEGLDELSTLGKTRISELRREKIDTYYIEPEEYGIDRAQAEDLEGGGPKENAEILESILAGENGPMRDIVVLNAGAAIYTADSARTLKAGIEMAEGSIDSDRALDALNKLIEVSNDGS